VFFDNLTMTKVRKTFCWNVVIIAVVSACVLIPAGCGTTKWSDTSRTGTEQLLISNAIDSSVGKIDFRPIGDKRIFLKTDAIADITDHQYLAMALRQQIAANGGIICDHEEDAEYVVEIRVGAIGTDRDDTLIGIPALTMPSIPGTNFAAGTIPEIPFIKRTQQRAVAKMALFAYNKKTGRPIWASGNSQSESRARNLWFAGMGPLTRGTIYDGTTFAGHSVPEVFENKKDRRIKSFADRVTNYRELTGDSYLNSFSPPSKTEEITTINNNVPLAPETSPPPAVTLPVPKYSEQIGKKPNANGIY
jgi:hypothetical protein